MRWWWFGTELSDEEIVRELTTMANAGLGGVEVAYVYPLQANTEAFLSDEFLRCLAFAAETAHSLELRFDITLGSGWPFGGPHITPETASRTLRWDARELGGEACELELCSPWQGDEIIGAYLGLGSLGEPPTSFRQVNINNSRLKIDAGTSPRVLALAWSSLTGQQVKRAAYGAEGKVLDHYSARAVKHHLGAVGDRILTAIRPEQIGSVFCDSLEAYESNWTNDIAAEFYERTGQRLVPDLWRLRFDSPESRAFRDCFYRTLSDVFEENFIRVVHDWASKAGIPFRMQNYGVPVTRLSGYRAVDVIEGEGWGWRELTPSRWASSAAHHYKRQIVSSEVWTWVHSPSLRATPLDLKGEAHEHFLQGANHLIGHGWPSSPANATGIGNIFYASGALDARNAWWCAVPSLMKYLTRMSWLLRQGMPVTKVTVYVSTSDIYNMCGLEQGGSLDTRLSAQLLTGEGIPGAIRDAGFDFDLVDDHMIADLEPAVAACRGPIIVAHAMNIPAEVQSWLRCVEQAGGVIVTVTSHSNVGDHPGFLSSDESLTQTLQEISQPDVVIKPSAEDIGFIHRRLDTDDIYFFANTSNQTHTIIIALEGNPLPWERLSAESGLVVARGNDNSKIPLTLAAYEGAIIVSGESLRARTNEESVRISYKHAQNITAWTVQFPDNEATPVTFPHEWPLSQEHYAGSAIYRCTVNTATLWGDEVPERVVLNLGTSKPEPLEAGHKRDTRLSSYRARVIPPVNAVAVVIVNNTDCGVVYAPPYEVDITRALQRGDNSLELVVCNSSAGYLSRPDIQDTIKDVVAQSHHLYGERFHMQDLAHAKDGVKSGLLAVPQLQWM